MKDKVPRVTLKVSIVILALIAIGLYFLNRPNAILALFSVVVLSIVYLGGMEKDHEIFMRHHHKYE
ncbi:hypothetical protein [Companilactobacillus alimentarius]|uniref:Uncharacterized protein n=1 Tax=Companilactobacillus alimentarius DSM 20249 TaxID=1423720 RepID=A0A2K9HJI1_9LACO|nr:hypothetical protein [Companilactobacillus alimentarius]AUI71926.1 hypothetical protein LA20249_06950 [Companilactobacillus alimentarius DSM 20249]KRK77872.1 hypothetical protein FC67_GL001203 [Companilactobacillus alimentarius DSM 20249]MDT6952453.1 hypothetical protein [Companilactobacillus alimentarius]GEO45323.1 hypothetical protein LAL01_15550 [Companilactobacillus alimentarius]